MANMTQYVFGVTADTKAAEKSLSSLSKSLRSLQTKRISLDVDDSRINAAAEAAELLQHELTKAMNVKTNSLDLSKLTAGLKAANTDVSQLGKTLLNAGTEGQRAFSQLANTIANSQAPVKQLSKAFSTMGTTLMNTIKWQASSSLIHGLMSTISGAISYAKNLNSTLNDIRVVTGASEAEMSRFASTANKMAKELSTTTNEFAKASLIYYQQGDSAELAAKKAAITVKAANVAFTASAQEMSEMLTAVWNSYQMGEDQLEHAVDVMAALGATTASSMEEMATAMQKVAATANNVGVSMEQMSAIVSTAASVTRQAPETIGTAWNTILNRISGLKLGETLEDGVDLNKYSKALATIGVNILDASGELRDMGTVIDEIGAKWENLSKAQQSALAQTIGGARQYTQINAFFDNFEKYQKNMETARNSEGALQEQADIYAESWEAASNRVRASLESIYTQIFDDKALTKMTSFFATLIDHIGKLTTSFGGIGNVVSLLATQIISTHLEQFSTRLVEIGQNIKQVFSGNAEIQNYADSIAQIQQQMTQALDYSDMSASGEIELKYDIEILNVKRQIAEQQGKMTQAQREAAEISIRNLQQDKQYYVQQAEQAEKIAKALREQNVEQTKMNQAKAMSKKAFEDYGTFGSHEKMIVDNMMADDLNNYFSLLGESGKQAYQTLEDIATELGVIQDADQTLSLDVFNQSIEVAHDNLTQVESAITYLKESFTGVNGQFAIAETMDPSEVLGNALNGASFAGMSDTLKADIAALKEELKGLSPDSTSTEQWQAFAQKVSSALNLAKTEAEDFKNRIKTAVSGTELAGSVDELNGHFDKFSANTEKVADAAAANLAKLKGEIDTKLSAASQKVQTFVSASMALLRCTTAINALGNAFKTLQDSDADAWTKITTCISTLVTVAMAASSVMQVFSKSTLSAKLAAAKLEAQEARTSVMTAAHAGAATAAAGANTSMGVGFHAAAAGAKAFMASLGPIGWILLAVTVIGGAVAGITNAIANQKKEIAKNKKEAVDAYEGIISKQSNLSASYTSLNSILSDNTKTLSEQLDKINEITEAWGLQVDAVDLAGESYAGLNSKLLNYQRSSILDDIAVLEQASEKYKNNITQSNTYYTKLESEIMGQFDDEDSEMYVRYKNHVKANTTEEQFNNDWEFNDKWGEITYFGDDDLYMPDWFVNYLKESKGLTINDIGEFANNSDSLQLFDSEKVGFGLVDEDFVKQSFNLTDAGLQRLVDAGVYTKQEYSTGAPPKYRRNIITADQWPEIEELLQDPSLYTNQAELEQLAAMQKTLQTKYGINNILQNNDNIDLLNISGEKVGLSDFNKLMQTNGIANPDWTMLSDMAAFFQDLPAYTDAASQYIQLGQYAQTLKTASGSQVEIPDIQQGLINFLESDTAKEMELDVDTLVTLRPGALAIDATGKITVNDNDAIDLAKLKIKADNLDIEADKLETFKGWKEDTLTAEQYTEMKESGYFTEEELSTLLYGDKKVRQNLLDKKIEANKKAQNDTDKDLLAKNRIEQDRIKEDQATWEAQKATNETEYYSYQTKGRVQVKDRSYVQLATDLSTARSRSSVYGKGLALNGIEYDKLTDDQKKDALAAYNALMNTNKTELDEEMYKGMMGEGNIKIMQDRRTQAEETVQALSGVVDEYEILDSRLSELETEEEDLEASTTAYDEYDGKIAKIKQLNTAITTYQGLVGKNKKLSADELKSLKEINQELYTKYKTGQLTDEEWDEAVRNAEIEKLQQLKTEYQNANQEEQAFATQQEIDAIKQEQNTAAIEKATKAYSKYTQEITKLKDTSSKMKSGVDILTNNIDSGKELTQEQVTTLSQSGLTIDVDAYNNAANATERAAIAANAWSQYLIQSQTVLEKEQALYNNIDARAQDKLDNWSPTALEKQIKDVDKFIIDEFGALGPEVEGQAKAMFEQMEKDGIDTSQLTYEQAFKYLCEYSKKGVNENQEAFDLIKATGIDSMKSLWKAAADEEKAAAEKAVSDWETAFNKISKARQAMLKGEDINGQISSFEDYTTLLEQSGLDEAEFNRRLTTGESINFTLPSLSEHQALLQKTTGLTDENYNFADNALLQKWQMNSNITDRIMKERPELETEDEIVEAARSEALSQIETILKSKYGDTKDDKEIRAMAIDYWDNWTEEKWGQLGEIAKTVDSRTKSYAQHAFREEQKTEGEILKSAQLEQKTTAYNLLKTALSDSTVRDKWWDTEELTATDLQDLADAMGMTVSELKDLDWKEVETRFSRLAVEIDNTETEFSKFKAALAAGEFDNKSLSNYTTLTGERIWTDEQNQLNLLTEEGFNELSDAQTRYNQFVEAATAKGETFAGTVVKGTDGKYYIVEGGQVESAITASYSSSVAPETTYQTEAADTLKTAREENQEAWRSKIGSDASKLDTVQLAIKKDGKAAADDWQALSEQLDLTNPKIQQAYENFRTAASEVQNMDLKGEAAMDHMRESTEALTTALLEQGGVILEDNQVNNDFLQTLYEEYQIGDELGNAFTVQSLNAMRAKTSLTALQSTSKSLNTAYTKLNKTVKSNAKTFKDFRKELKNSDKTLEDYLKDNKDLTDEEKDLMRDTNKLMDSFEDLGKKLGLTGDDLDNFVDGMMECDSTSAAVTKALKADASGIVDAFNDAFDANGGNNAVANAFKNWEQALGEGANEFISSAAEMLNMTEADVTTLMNKCTNAIAEAGGDLTAVDWGTLANDMGVDISTILAIMQDYLSVLQQANAIEGFDVAGLIGQLQAAISAAQAFQGKHGGGGSTNGTPDSSSSGGGGGGGSKKNYENHKKYTEETERYHEINQQLEKQQRLLDQIDKKKSMTYGAAHLRALDEEIAALEKENDLNQQKLDETRANLSANGTILQSYGATMNSDGTINYSEIMTQAVNEYNAAVDKYNTSEQTAQDELALQRAKEHYEELMQLIEDYEEDLKQQDELEADILENQIKRSAAEIEKIEYTIEIKFDLNDRSIKELQYFRTKWEDTLKKQGDSFNGMVEEAYKYEDNLNTLGTAVATLNEKYLTGVTTQADYAAELQNLNDKMLEQLENLTTIKKTIKEAYGNTLELAGQEMQKFTSILDHSREVMESYISMQQLMGRGQNFSELTKFYKTQYDSSLAAAEAAKTYNDELLKSKELIEAQIEAAGGWESAGEVLKQQWSDVNSALQENENDLLSKTQQALEDAQAMFENTLQAAIDSFDKMMTAAGTKLRDLEDDYAYYQEEKDRYLSTAKELYEVSKLNREIETSLADSTTKASKERLKALKEEINAKAEAGRLTEYDVNMMELQYKYALALEDLEDKKNAKSIVRLTRDEAGNYGYQYTANEEEVSGAAQQVEDVLDQIHDLASSRVAEIEQAALTAEREYRDGLLEIAQDTTLTLDERMAKMQELTRQHQETMKYYQEQYGNATSNLLENQRVVYERYGVSMLENSGKIQKEINADVKSMLDNVQNYAAELSKLMSPGGTIYEAMQKYKADIALVQDTTGLSWANMTANTEEYAAANEKAKDAIKEVKSELDTAITSIDSATKTWQAHGAVLDSIISKYETLNTATVGRLNDLAGEDANISTDDGKKSHKWQFSWAYKGLYGVASNFDTRDAAYDAAVTDMSGKFKSLVQKQDEDADTTTIENTVKAWIDEAIAAGKININEYAHGGLVDYTGPAWVDGTKSAPELMLNASDTQNLLSTIDLLHSIDTQMIKNLFDTMQMSAMAIMSGFGSLTSGSVMMSKDRLEQDVHIEANFPNVTEKDEIVDAFNDLINLASQYANR